jgi:hypothetical protein
VSALQPTHAVFKSLEIAVVYVRLAAFTVCLRGLPIVRRRTGLQRDGGVRIENMVRCAAVVPRLRLTGAGVASGGRAGWVTRAAWRRIGAERGFMPGRLLRMLVAVSGVERALPYAGRRSIRLRALRGVVRCTAGEMLVDIRPRLGARMRVFRCVGRAKRIMTALDRIRFRLIALARLAREIVGHLDGIRRFS